MSGGGGGGSSGGSATPAKPAVTYPEMETFAASDPGLLNMLAQQMQQGFGGGLLNYQNDLNGMYAPVNIPILANPSQYEKYANKPLTQAAKSSAAVTPKPTAVAPKPAAKSSSKPTSSIDLAEMRRRQSQRATSD